MSTSYWVYILQCNNNAYYTGYTTDLMHRYQQHLQGTGAKYTRSFKPIRIAQSWEVKDKSMAMQMESYIKSLSKVKKQKLILQPAKLMDVFSEVSLII